MFLVVQALYNIFSINLPLKIHRAYNIITIPLFTPDTYIQETYFKKNKNKHFNRLNQS